MSQLDPSLTRPNMESGPKIPNDKYKPTKAPLWGKFVMSGYFLALTAVFIIVIAVGAALISEMVFGYP